MLAGEAKTGVAQDCDDAIPRDQVMFGEIQVSRPFIVIEVDDHDSPGRTKAGFQLRDIVDRVFHMMIDVAEKNQIDASKWQGRIMW